MIYKNRYKHRSTSLASAVAIALLGNSGLALAQEVVVKEIIVTGQKRSESIQDIPSTVNVIDGDALKLSCQNQDGSTKDPSDTSGLLSSTPFISLIFT